MTPDMPRPPKEERPDRRWLRKPAAGSGDSATTPSKPKPPGRPGGGRPGRPRPSRPRARRAIPVAGAGLLSVGLAIWSILPAESSRLPATNSAGHAGLNATLAPASATPTATATQPSVSETPSPGAASSATPPTATVTPSSVQTATPSPSSTSTPPAAYSITATASPTTVRPGQHSTISVAVADAQGHPVNGDTISFSVSGSGCSSVSPASAQTDSGMVQVSYVAGTQPATCTVIAVESANGKSTTVTLHQTGG